MPTPKHQIKDHLHIIEAPRAHNTPEGLPGKIGVLLVQLGTPDEATVPAVKRYLREFLGDRRVVDLNRVLWFFILNFIILTFRPKKSAALYERLFKTYGPILRTYSKSLAQKIQNQFEDSSVIVRYGMRYGNPSVKKVLKDMFEKDRCHKILIVPLFPQYSGTTTASVYDAVSATLNKMRWGPAIRFLDSYYNHEEYIEAQAKLINEALKKRSTPPQKIILSYHGIPKRYVQKGDPYHKMCHTTSKLLRRQIQFPADQIIQTYQSRFGKEPWLQPYTDETIENLAKEGLKDILVACPAFTMDCLETLDEIAVENRHVFIENGGERLELVSCLNDHDHWAKSLSKIITENLQGWV